MTKVFNRKSVDWTKQPMFFGDEPNTQRFDQQKYPVFEKLNQQQLGFFWRPEEVSLQKDRVDYKTLNSQQKHIYTSNLKYIYKLRAPERALFFFVMMNKDYCLNVLIHGTL